MQSPSAATTRAAETIVAATRALLTPGTPRILIALDGPSGSGKSTLAAVIVLDGAYTARPELEDLVDLAVLVEASEHARHARLAAREAASFLTAWHQRWDAAESFYFTHVRPASSFDLIVSTS